MQLDREGINDSQQTSGSINLEEHFKQQGLSAKAYAKISEDVESGDMNVDILVEFDENELISMTNDYKFTRLQSKAFIKAVKLLPNSKANRVGDHDHEKNNNKKWKTAENDEDSKSHFVHVYVTPEEQSVFEKLNKLQTMLDDYGNKYTTIALKNKDLIELNISKIEQYRKTIKQGVDNTVNDIVQTVCSIYINNICSHYPLTY